MFEGNMSALMQQFPSHGELTWIGLRPGRKQAMVSMEEVEVDTLQGLIGDHYSGRGAKRQLTLFQWEHLAVIESFVGKSILPELLRRNLVIKGINLNSLKKQSFKIGSAVFKTTGLCHPCSRMETVLGCGGYNAMRSHGGITVQVIQSGKIKIGDDLIVN